MVLLHVLIEADIKLRKLPNVCFESGLISKSCLDPIKEKISRRGMIFLLI